MHPLSLMIKPASSNCNLKCSYCFYHSLADGRNDYSFGTMDRETMSSLIDKAISFTSGRDIYFAFQGGEPLIAGKGFFNEFVDLVKIKNKRSRIFYSIQTNGTLIDEEWCRFFNKNKFLIGLSLDGNRTANINRRYHDDKECFLDIINASELMHKHKVEFNILTVVTRPVYEKIEEIYDYYKSRGFRYLQFINCLRPFNYKGADPIYLTVQEYGDFLNRLFRKYYNDIMKNNYISIRQFDNYARLAKGLPAEQCGMSGNCTYQIVVEGNGNLYPCDFYCTDEWLLGNIKDTNFYELDKNKRIMDFVKESLIKKLECRECNYYKLCFNGCKRYRADADYCPSYKQFFDESLPMIRNIINKLNREYVRN